MRPEEIRPDTKLVTIIGYNAQTGKSRKYFNTLMKTQNINATAIALNIKDEHFSFTMQNLAKSKVDKMILEPEFKELVLKYCDSSNSDFKVDIIEIIDGKIVGINLDDELKNLQSDISLWDLNMIEVAKMMIVANRWYSAKIELDNIPLMIR
jgi:hypothetical protein